MLRHPCLHILLNHPGPHALGRFVVPELRWCGLVPAKWGHGRVARTPRRNPGRLSARPTDTRDACVRRWLPRGRDFASAERGVRGEVDRRCVIRDVSTNASRGFGFVKFATVAQAASAIGAMHGAHVRAVHGADGGRRLRHRRELHESKPARRVRRDVPDDAAPIDFPADASLSRGEVSPAREPSPDARIARVRRTSGQSARVPPRCSGHATVTPFRGDETTPS